MLETYANGSGGVLDLNFDRALPRKIKLLSDSRMGNSCKNRAKVCYAKAQKLDMYRMLTYFDNRPYAF